MTRIKLLINATNITVGGGKRLLIELMNAVPDNIYVLLYLDPLFPIQEVSLPTNISYKTSSPGLINKVILDFKIKKISHNFDIILYLSNLPPVSHIKNNLTLFLQNRLILERGFPAHSPIEFKLKLIIQRLWFHFFLRKKYKVIVQTQSMKNIFLRKLYPNDIKIFSFAPTFQAKESKRITRADPSKDAAVFLYPSDYQPHKNHYHLIQAWIILKNIAPHKKLLLTIKKKDLSPQLNQLVLDGNPNVEFLGPINYQELIKLYKNVDALVFPSLCESLGLPLLEAQVFQLPVIASDLDFVKEICPMASTFSPKDAGDIAENILKFKAGNYKTIPITLTAEDFLNNVIASNEKRNSPPSQ